MNKIDEFRLFQKEDIEWLQTWFEDGEVQKRLEGMMPLHDWYDFVEENENYQVWAALQGGKPVGAVMVEVEEDFTGILLFWLILSCVRKDMVKRS